MLHPCKPRLDAVEGVVDAPLRHSNQDLMPRDSSNQEILTTVPNGVMMEFDSDFGAFASLTQIKCDHLYSCPGEMVLLPAG